VVAIRLIASTESTIASSIASAFICATAAFSWFTSYHSRAKVPLDTISKVDEYLKDNLQDILSMLYHKYDSTTTESGSEESSYHTYEQLNMKKESSDSGFRFSMDTDGDFYSGHPHWKSASTSGSRSTKTQSSPMFSTNPKQFRQSSDGMSKLRRSQLRMSLSPMSPIPDGDLSNVNLAEFAVTLSDFPNKETIVKMTSKILEDITSLIRVNK